MAVLGLNPYTTLQLSQTAGVGMGSQVLLPTTCPPTLEQTAMLLGFPEPLGIQAMPPHYCQTTPGIWSPRSHPDCPAAAAALPLGLGASLPGHSAAGPHPRGVEGVGVGVGSAPRRSCCQGKPEDRCSRAPQPRGPPGSLCSCWRKIDHCPSGRAQ